VRLQDAHLCLTCDEPDEEGERRHSVLFDGPTCPACGRGREQAWPVSCWINRERPIAGNSGGRTDKAISLSVQRMLDQYDRIIEPEFDADESMKSLLELGW
jgi:hypothetical protein